MKKYLVYYDIDDTDTWRIIEAETPARAAEEYGNDYKVTSVHELGNKIRYLVVPSSLAEYMIRSI